jgi:hypothetical protein
MLLVLLRKGIGQYHKPPRSTDTEEDEDLIESGESCQQGANDGSADFAIGPKNILLGIRERHPGITVSVGHDCAINWKALRCGCSAH